MANIFFGGSFSYQHNVRAPNESKYSKVDQVKFVEDSLIK